MKNNIKLLDCTLRDGGYIVNWVFGDDVIKTTAKMLTDANIDIIECGYLNNADYVEGKSIFKHIEQIGEFIPKNRKNALYLAMADVLQYKPEDITDYTGNSIDGIRVVFYKHQVEEAMALSKRIVEAGYKLFVQPMVTIDYTKQEYADLIARIAKLKPQGVAIVDSFGYMLKEDFRYYFSILDTFLDEEVWIGFHSHNNMQLAFITAQDVCDYETNRTLVIDSSLYGMGRGAGNLNTELFANYFNMVSHYKYNIEIIMDAISEFIMPIAKTHVWGYSPYLYLTALYHCHPNFACYLLEKHDVTVSQFRDYIQLIPTEMKTKCRKPYVEELYEKFCEKYGIEGK